MTFKDHFSRQASDYTKYRPHYPDELFEYLASLVDRRETAWDCATGNGQAAHGLAPYFARIIATDASERQIAHAREHERISYAVAPAEGTEIESGSIDLIVVAQSLHWFDLERFYIEVRRILTEGGVIAVWCYSLPRVSREIDSVIDWFYSDVVGAFWPPERKLVDDRYRSIPFPFQELSAKPFQMLTEWNMNHLMGYLSTWSSVQGYRKAGEGDPMECLTDRLPQAWGPSERVYPLYWPINMRVGRYVPGWGQD
jgi:SAM-dependent methyltransferase